MHVSETKHTVSNFVLSAQAIIISHGDSQLFAFLPWTCPAFLGLNQSVKSENLENLPPSIPSKSVIRPLGKPVLRKPGTKSLKPDERTGDIRGQVKQKTVSVDVKTISKEEKPGSAAEIPVLREKLVWGLTEELDLPHDGQWSSWSVWSDCTKKCSGGEVRACILK